MHSPRANRLVTSPVLATFHKRSFEGASSGPVAYLATNRAGAPANGDRPFDGDRAIGRSSRPLQPDERTAHGENCPTCDGENKRRPYTIDASSLLFVDEESTM
uniref:Uncharacterized protein n=1 Tax=Plectus sambesii TaxID=2011161 RepID=A0A914UJF9_9BILA